MLSTLNTATANLLDEAFKVVLAVMIGDFFPDLDIFLGYDVDTIAPVPSLRIGTTGMIGIARRVVAWTAIDVPLGVHVKHVAIVSFIADRGGDLLTDILDDSRPLFDGCECKESQSGTAPLDDNIR